jgi:hypothetical protein
VATTTNKTKKEEQRTKVLTWNALLVLVFLFISGFGCMATRMCFYFASRLQQQIRKYNTNCEKEASIVWMGSTRIKDNRIEFIYIPKIIHSTRKGCGTCHNTNTNTQHKYKYNSIFVTAIYIKIYNLIIFN